MDVEKAHISLVTVTTEDAIAHMASMTICIEVATSHVDTATSHTEDAETHMEDTIVHT